MIYALNLLEKSGYYGFTTLLEVQLAEGQDVEVKKYALDRMEAKGKIDINILKKLYAEETDEEFETESCFTALQV